MMSNLTKLLKGSMKGRQKWQSEYEFSYYSPDDDTIRQSILNQVLYEEECYFTGFKIARNMGILKHHILLGAKVLDLGAGECALSPALMRAGVSELFAVDAIPSQIWAAAAHHDKTDKMHFLIADAFDLPFKNASFDLVVCNDVLHHLEPLTSVLDEAFRVLRPGGLFVAFEPGPSHAFFVYYIKKKSSKNEAVVSSNAYKKAFNKSKSGFEEVEVRYVFPSLSLIHHSVPANILGPFSPQILIRARTPGMGKATINCYREINPTILPNLFIDTGCQFASLAQAQIEDIATRWFQIEEGMNKDRK
jgi:ubiquinone/menaquinone biosynthesis C-methylase UbiE